MKRFAGLAAGTAMAILALFPARAYAVPVPWKNCGAPTDLVQVTRANTSVWPPSVGAPITVSVAGNVRQAIHAVSRTVRLTYLPAGGPPILFVSSRNQIPVEIAAGPFSLTQALAVPRSISPGGVMMVHVDEALASGQGVLCVDLTVPFK